MSATTCAGEWLSPRGLVCRAVPCCAVLCCAVTDGCPCRDYYGARDGRLAALLVRRPGAEGEGEAREAGEDLRGVDVVPGLLDVVEWVRRRNAGSGQA